MIATAVQKGAYVYLYNERGGQLCSIYCGNDGSLQGYTASTVSIRKVNMCMTKKARKNRLFMLDKINQKNYGN